MRFSLLSCLFVCCCLSGPLSAQFDFPLLTNGLAVRLDEQGEARLAAADFLAHPELLPACATGTLLIGRSSSLSPRGDTPPPTVGDSIVFTCDEFVFVPIEIWYRRIDNEWLVADTYVLLGGVAECTCPDTLPACILTTPVVYNGLSVSFGPGDSSTVAASAYAIKTEPGTTYSFTADPADSLLVVKAGTESPEIVNIHAIRPGFTTRSVTSYLILPDSAAAAASPLAGGPAGLVIHGLVVPVSSDLVVTVPARAFAVPGNRFPGRLAFSPDPTDTLRTFPADSIGLGGRPLQLYRHAPDGSVGPPAVSYLTPDDPRRLKERTEVLPANDSISGALSLSSLIDCLLFQQNGRSTLEATESGPCTDLPADWAADTLTGSLWYRIASDPPTIQQLRIVALDTLQAAVYASETGDCFATVLPDSGPSYLLPGDTTTYLLNCGGDVFPPAYLLQMDRVGAGPGRFLIQLTHPPDACTDVAEIFLPAPGFTLFPNPARDQVTLQLSQPFATGSHLALYGPTGRLLTRSVPATGAMTHILSLAHRPAGVYQVVVYQPGLPPLSRGLLIQ
ncbi:MAG: hypothetical protein WBA17_01275 [Saprospiraceae bacterium]